MTTLKEANEKVRAAVKEWIINPTEENATRLKFLADLRDQKYFQGKKDAMRKKWGMK